MSEVSVEYVVDRLGNSPGRVLLTYREVALPFWSIPIVCRIQEEKSLDALPEFVLRSADAGLDSAAEIASFLGVSIELIEGVMAEMVSQRNLHAVRSKDGTRIIYRLTQKGQTLSRELIEHTPRTVTIDFSYDGLVHEFGAIDPSLRWRPQDIKQAEILEIPAFPADPPEIGPSMTSEVNMSFLDGNSPKRAHLMSVLGTEGKRTKFFLKAVALVFQSVDNSAEYSIQFAIDGRRSEKHEMAFDAAEGLRKLGILDSLRSAPSPVQDILSPEIMQQAADTTESAVLRGMTTILGDKAASLQQSIRASDIKMNDALISKLELAEDQLFSAQEALERLPVRTLEVQEHAEYLDRALSESKDRLLIVSPWIREAIVDNMFTSKLTDLLESGVRVQIGYGIGSMDRDTSADKRGISILASIQKKYPNFAFKRLGNTHAKILASDSRFVIVTSFNWLSFRGDPKRPFRDERGVIVTTSSEVDKIFDDYGRKFGSQDLYS